MNQHNIKKKYNISLRRYYSTDSDPNNMSSLVGMGKEQFVQYVNNQLVSNMTPFNYGSIWSIDHIVPMELFDLNDPEQ